MRGKSQKHSWNKKDQEGIEIIHEYIDSQKRAANEYVKHRMPSFRYFHNIFDGGVKRYYCGNVQDKAFGYMEAKNVMEEKYSSMALKIVSDKSY